jgi:hypothetical protein
MKLHCVKYLTKKAGEVSMNIKNKVSVRKIKAKIYNPFVFKTVIRIGAIVLVAMSFLMPFMEVLKRDGVTLFKYAMDAFNYDSLYLPLSDENSLRSLRYIFAWLSLLYPIVLFILSFFVKTGHELWKLMGRAGILCFFILFALLRWTDEVHYRVLNFTNYNGIIFITYVALCIYTENKKYTIF